MFVLLTDVCFFCTSFSWVFLFTTDLTLSKELFHAKINPFTLSLSLSYTHIAIHKYTHRDWVHKIVNLKWISFAIPFSFLLQAKYALKKLNKLLSRRGKSNKTTVHLLKSCELSVIFSGAQTIPIQPTWGHEGLQMLEHTMSRPRLFSEENGSQRHVNERKIRCPRHPSNFQIQE